MNPDEPTPPPQTSATILSGPGRVNWLAFWIVLLAPAVLTIGSVLVGSRTGEAAPGIALIGGGISGIVCGAMMGRRFGRTNGMKILLGIIFAAVFAVVCIATSCCGCLASGFNLNF